MALLYGGKNEVFSHINYLLFNDINRIFCERIGI
jgi:hypothetical protein